MLSGADPLYHPESKNFCSGGRPVAACLGGKQLSVHEHGGTFHWDTHPVEGLPFPVSSAVAAPALCGADRGRSLLSVSVQPGNQANFGLYLFYAAPGAGRHQYGLLPRRCGAFWVVGLSFHSDGNGLRFDLGRHFSTNLTFYC